MKIWYLKLHRLFALTKITFYMQKKMSGILQLLLLKHCCVWTTCKCKHMPTHVHTWAHSSNNNPQPLLLLVAPLVLLRTLLKILRMDPCVLLKPWGDINFHSTPWHCALRIPALPQDCTDPVPSSSTVLEIEFIQCYQLSNKTPNTRDSNWRSLTSKIEGFHFSAVTMKVTPVDLFGPR